MPDIDVAKPMSITVSTDALHRIISDTWQFTDEDGGAVLGAIYLTTAGGYLVASATDRYVGAWSRTATTNPAGFQAAIPRDVVTARWLPELAAHPSADATITVVPGKHLGKVTLTCGTSAHTHRTTASADIYPPASVLNTLLDARQIDQPGVILDPTRVAPFTAVAVSRLDHPAPLRYDEDGEPLWTYPAPPMMAVQFVGGPHAPLIRVTIGDDFIGCLSVARANELLWQDVSNPTAWREIAGATESQAGEPDA